MPHFKKTISIIVGLFLTSSFVNAASFSLGTFIQYTGEGAYDAAGTALAFGDINGDGYEDVLIGAPKTSSSSTSLPAVYLSYGRSDRLLGGSLSFSRITKFEGEFVDDSTGAQMATGDINGDGFDDILIASRNHDAEGTARGLVSLVYGRRRPLESVSLSDSSVVEFTGEADYYRLGDSIATGDVNGDGYDDIFIGSQRSDEDGSCCYSGAGYLIYGQADALSSIDMLDPRVVRIAGDANYDYGGFAVAVGNIDGDGYEDLLFSAPYHRVSSGTEGIVYLIRGNSTQLNSMSVNDADVISFSGESSGDLAGYSLGIGDVNADGFDDILIGAIGNDEGGTGAGAVYLVYGQSSLTSRSLSDSSIVQFTGKAAGDQTGRYTISLGDINGDAFDDVVLSGWYNDDTGNNSGAVYFIFGQSEPLSSLGLSDSTITQFTGEAEQDYAGRTVAVGDANGDGKADVLVAATGNDEGGAEAGAVYLIYSR